MALGKAKVGTNGALFHSSLPSSIKYGNAAFGYHFGLAESSKEAHNDVKGGRLLTLKLLRIKTA